MPTDHHQKPIITHSFMEIDLELRS